MAGCRLWSLSLSKPSRETGALSRFEYVHLLSLSFLKIAFELAVRAPRLVSWIENLDPDGSSLVQMSWAYMAVRMRARVRSFRKKQKGLQTEPHNRFRGGRVCRQHGGLVGASRICIMGRH